MAAACAEAADVAGTWYLNALIINGATLSEPYATGPSEDYTAVLAQGEYLVLGDNRAESYDSRAGDMGFISAENLLGRVRLVLFPFRNIK